KRLDDATYRWIWEGAYLEASEAQIFNGKYEELEFKPNQDFNGPYFGLDFGFAKDPTAAVKCWVFDNNLYIEHEAGKTGLELDHTAGFLKERVPDIEKYILRADSARPESISYLKRNGVPRIEGVKKWSGSVEDGIEHIKSYRKIYIHPRCKETLREFRLYSYKTDRLTGDVLPTVLDEHNHYIDAIRYALNPLIQSKNAAGIFFS
ncbi:PBSX family phage terminase large subunit, partial [Pasteurella multocida]